MSGAGTADLVVQLSRPQQRAQAAPQLAAAVGAERLILLVRDPVLDAMLPAPGLEQTFYGGAAWRSFVSRCKAPGRHQAEVDLPAERLSPAIALAVDDLAAVFIGGHVEEQALGEVERLLPMLAVALRAEQQAHFAESEAREARQAAGRAEALARALEAARADHAQLNAELRAEQRRKDEFLAMLAHELRNPLTPLVNALELLRRRVLDEAGTERMLDIAGRQLNQLIRLVEDLLDVSRVSRGHIELRRETHCLKEILAHALDANRPILGARQHEVSLSLPPEPLPVFADSARLTQVFSNLLHNAAKYTDPGGRVLVSAWREDAHAVVRVQDNGIGMPSEVLAKVFDLFAQAPGARARAPGGLGIGLTLVRSLVELHGGQVHAESDGLGKGSAFVVRLPLAHAAQAGTRGSALAGGRAARPMRVLVVDDNQDAADTLAAVLRAGGHVVEVAYSGAAALQAAPDIDPDVVFLDLGLPGMDGFEVLARLRRSLRRSVRIAALTGYGTEGDKRRTREAGFDTHLVKPVKNEELDALLATIAANLAAGVAAV